MERTPLSKASLSGGVTAEARAVVSVGIEPRIDRLRQFDLRKRLFEVCFFVALWLGGATLTLTFGFDAQGGPFAWSCYCLGIACSAIAINAFVLLLHEGMHGVLFRGPFWNRWVSVLLGAPVLMSFSAYRVMHLRHHTYLGDPRDPDDYRNHTRSRFVLWSMHYLRLALGAFLYLLLIPRLAWRHGSGKDRRQVLEEYLFLGALCAVVALTVPGWAILHGWFVPAVLVGYMINVRGFTQHGITDAEDPFLASRSIQAHPVVAFCLLYENYHLEHHFYPEVPSYHLPELHRLLWPRLPRAVTGKSYLAFVVRFLRATWARDETPIGLTTPAREQAVV